MRRLRLLLLFALAPSSALAGLNNPSGGGGPSLPLTVDGAGTGVVAVGTIVGSNISNGNNAVSTNYQVGGGLIANTSGGHNTAVGVTAGNGITSGSNNTGVGYGTLTSTASGYSNTVIGAYAGNAIYSAGNNTAVGFGALTSSQFGSGNTALGENALGSASGATHNTTIGMDSGAGITSGSSNTILGRYTGAGAPINSTGSNYVVLSDGSGTIGAYIDPSLNFVVSGPVVRPGYTVSALPTGITGGMAYVTDAVACTFLTGVTGGGSAFCPVIYNGSAWVAE